MRVLLVDDHALFRAGIASLLGAWGMEVEREGQAPRRFRHLRGTMRERRR